MTPYPVTPAVPITPQSRIPRSPLPAYPFAEMQPGDSFFAAEPSKLVRDAANQYRRRYAPNTGWTIRGVTEDGVPGCRLWRTA